MDILNPLYLRAQKLLRTSAEPGSIVYLSTQDPKRDDKFLTIGIPIEYLADVIGALTTVETDGVTITGDGTPGNPLVAVPPVQPLSISFKYTQTGTDAPVPVVANSNGITLTGMTRSGVGTYFANFSGTPFADASKVIVLVSNGDNTAATVQYIINGVNQLFLASYFYNGTNWTYTDNFPYGVSVKIEVYP